MKRTTLFKNLCLQRKGTFIVLFVFLPSLVFCQKSDFVYSAFLGITKSAQVELCDSAGKVPLTNEAFNKNRLLYLAVKSAASSSITFNNKDVEGKLKELKLVQNGKALAVATITPVGKDGEYHQVLIGYPKNEIDITQPFKIRNKDYETQSLTISEKLWPNYPLYTHLLSTSRQAIADKKYVEAFKQASAIWRKSTMTPYLALYSFYPGAKDTLNMITDRLFAETGDKLKKLSDRFHANVCEESINELNQELTILELQRAAVDSFYTSVTTYMDVKAKLAASATTKQQLAEERTVANDSYRKKMLSILSERNYQDYQYRIYTEYLFKLLTKVHGITQLSGVDSIPYVEVKQNRYAYKDLADMGWEKHFIVVCRLLNENIQSGKCVFSEQMIDNFGKNAGQEPQPYAVLSQAVNALARKDKALFTDLTTKALVKVNDKDLLSNLDLMITLMNGLKADGNQEFWTLLNAGYTAQNNGALQDAKAYFEKAEKLYNGSEILYFLLATVNLQLNDRFSAEVYFKRVNTMNPKFISARLFQIEFMLQDKDYDTALSLVNESLNNTSIWYFYFKLAQLQFAKNMLEDARQTIVGKCIEINPLNYDQFLLLGDVFAAQNDIRQARENYLKAGNLRPNSPEYKKRMELLMTKKPDAPVVPAPGTSAVPVTIPTTK